MPMYHVTFERIGRNRSVKPLTVSRDNELGLLESISRYARPHLRSRDYEVVLEPCRTRGYIACGMHLGGNFEVALDGQSRPDASQDSAPVVSSLPSTLTDPDNRTARPLREGE